jgi:polysaccharide pyruvyl transferase WcaK-like protein
MYVYAPSSSLDDPARNQVDVGLVNTYSTRNLGDAAIMAALAQLVPAGTVRASIADAVPCVVPGIRLTPSLEGCDAFISVGGDIFNNARPAFVTRNFISNVMQLYWQRGRAMVFGQTIPSSCHGLSLSLLAETLRRIRSVTVRDEESQRLLERYGVQSRLSYDAAFVLRPDLADIVAAEALFETAGLQADRTALISVRSFDGMYQQSPDTSLSKLIALARLLTDRGHQVAILIQADVGASDSDRHVAKQILSHVPEAKALDLFAGASKLPPVSLLMGVLSLANIVIGLRYHAAVLRLASGRHAYNLAYSRKGRDLGRRLALTGSTLEAFDVEAEIAAIESTADREFDAAPIAKDVSSAFADAYEKLQ